MLTAIRTSKIALNFAEYLDLEGGWCCGARLGEYTTLALSTHNSVRKNFFPEFKKKKKKKTLSFFN